MFYQACRSHEFGEVALQRSITRNYGRLVLRAQHNLAKVGVVGSNPIARSKQNQTLSVPFPRAAHSSG